MKIFEIFEKISISTFFEISKNHDFHWFSFDFRNLEKSRKSREFSKIEIFFKTRGQKLKKWQMF